MEKLYWYWITVSLCLQPQYGGWHLCLSLAMGSSHRFVCDQFVAFFLLWCALVLYLFLCQCTVPWFITVPFSYSWMSASSTEEKEASMSKLAWWLGGIRFIFRLFSPNTFTTGLCFMESLEFYYPPLVSIEIVCVRFTMKPTVNCVAFPVRIDPEMSPSAVFLQEPQGSISHDFLLSVLLLLVPLHFSIGEMQARIRS